MPTRRVALTGSYNTRQASVNALSSSSGIWGIGVWGTFIWGQAARSSDKDVRFINCMPITVGDQIAGTKRYYVVKRPGFVTSITPDSGQQGVAIHVWSGQGSGSKIISAFRTTNSRIFDSTVSLGDITGQCNGITETSISSTPTLAISSADWTGWYYQTTGALTKIADADFPGNNGNYGAVGTFAHLKGYAAIMDVYGGVWTSDLNSITSWTSTSKFPTNAYPDLGVGVVRHRDTILALCKQHFEVLYVDQNNASGSPLSRADNLTQQIGCVSADAITSIRDTVFFAGSSKQGVIRIFAYSGAATEPVSTPEIDAQLVLAGPNNISLTTAGFWGRHCVVVKASNTSYVYCAEEKAWHEWSSTTPLWYKMDGVSAGSSLFNYAVSNVSTAGKIWVFNPASNVYQDNGSAFTATIQTGPLDLGTMSRKFWHAIHVVGDVETATSSLGISWYDDDYVTPSTVRTVDLAKARRFLARCGQTRRRSFTLTHSANTPMRLEALEFDYSIGYV